MANLTLPLLGAPATLDDLINGLPALPYNGAPIVLSASGIVASHYTGPLGFTIANADLANQWNALMRATDISHIVLGQISQGYVSSIKAGTIIYADLQDSGTGASPVTQVTTPNLTTIDTALQARDGAVVEWIGFSDDQITQATVAQYISNLQTRVDAIHNFVRANGAPAFKVIYVPGAVQSGIPLIQTLLSNPIYVTYPDAFLLQSYTYRTTPNGADPMYIGTVATIASLAKSYAPTHPFHVQVQTYSKANPSQVWTAASTIADIDAIGALPGVALVGIGFSDASAQAAALAAFNTVIANYRP